MSARLKRTNSQSWLSGLQVKRVLITDKVSKILVDRLRDGGLEVVEASAKNVEELKALIQVEILFVVKIFLYLMFYFCFLLKGFDVLLVRSATEVTAEVIESANTLKLIGRAGTGVDNIDVVAATKKGILVMNTPGSLSFPLLIL